MMTPYDNLKVQRLGGHSFGDLYSIDFSKNY